jgi:4,5-DOPA dioxygenase extradiol
MNRREAMRILVAAGCAVPAVGLARPAREQGIMTDPSNDQAPTPGAMPVIFLAHGSPVLLDDVPWVDELKQWADSMPRPESILMVSAHWEQRPVTMGATRTVPLVYDFYGFPSKYYKVAYPAPGAPELADRVRELVGKSQPVAQDAERGLDHGAYVPLVAMYPDADVPVLQMSLPTMDPPELLALGRALAPLRREGVLIVGSGFLTHNLRMLDWRPIAPVPSWATEFDAWAADVLGRQDADALVAYRDRAPGVRQVLPTHEHFVPVVVALGAALEQPGGVRFPITGFTMGPFTRRSVQFG